MEQDAIVISCRPVVDEAVERALITIAAEVGKCEICGKDIWMALTSILMKQLLPGRVRALCNSCTLNEVLEHKSPAT